jgi:hypothetical protein
MGSMGDLIDARWDQVDLLLFDGLRIRALQAACEDLGMSLRDAIEAVPAHWKLLVQSSRDQFTVPLDGYWDDVYT